VIYGYRGGAALDDIDQTILRPLNHKKKYKYYTCLLKAKLLSNYKHLKAIMRKLAP
jgi:hypothetical protein